MINKDFKNILELINTFPDEESCIGHLESLRWEDGIVISPFDADSKVYVCKGNRYRCKNTGKYFNVKTSTLFDSTKVKLQKWFLAIWLVTLHKKDISSVQLSKDIGVTQKTAWFMLHRIRSCFGFDNDNNLTGEVELDETYIGGKNKNRHTAKKVEYSQGRSTKDSVFGEVQHGGKLNARHVTDVGARTLTNEILSYVSDATIYSDEWLGYKSLKRGIFVIYHFASVKHLQNYVDEFIFRYNTRKGNEVDRFNLLLKNSSCRLTYSGLING